jgi:enoyl-CoA hydratase
MSEHLKIEQDGRILRITFNRPDSGISDSMATAFAEAAGAAHLTSDVIVLRSAGPDFCTGRARDAVAPPPATEVHAQRPVYDAILGCYKAMRSVQVPVIGVIEGRAMGFGAAVASLCDASFASDKATFNIPETQHNVMPTMAMSAVADRMNRSAALWMTYSTDFIDAHHALSSGLISTVVPAARLNEEVDRFCEGLLSRPRPAILRLKEYLHVAPRMDEHGAVGHARGLHSIVLTSAAIPKPAFESTMNIIDIQSIPATRERVLECT